MNLALSPLESSSSWASLLRAYELWTLNEEEIHRQFTALLMRELPTGLEGDYRDPDMVFVTICDIAKEEIARLDVKVSQQPSGNRGRPQQMRRFWAQTLSAALDRNFTGMQSPARPNLRELLRAAKSRNEE